MRRPEAVRRVLRRLRGNAPDALEKAAWTLASERDMDAPWRRVPFDRAAVLGEAIAALNALGTSVRGAGHRDGYVAQKLGQIIEVADDLAWREREGGVDVDAREAAIATLLRGKLQYAWQHGKHGPLIAERDRTHELVTAAGSACDADLAAALRGELWPLAAAYDDRKRRDGLVDFFDLLVATRRLLRASAPVRARLRDRFTHLLVDEFQDTDPLQTDIVLLLASAHDDIESHFLHPRAGKLFVVGDPKQSIYRFRRADVAVYEQTKRGLVAGGATVLNLTTSFRSVPAIQSAVNAAFSLAMTTSTQAAYVPLAPFRAAGSGPAVIALPVPRPYGFFGKPTREAVEASLPIAVAALVEDLLGPAGPTIATKDGDRKLEARDVAVLFKAMRDYKTDRGGAYARELERRGIPHALAGGLSFHQRAEVVALRTMLAAIEHPDDELSVYGALRGPIFAIGDDELLAYRATHQRLLPYAPRAVIEPGDVVGPALDVLAKLSAKRNRRRIEATLLDVLGATRAVTAFANWSTGDQAVASVQRVLDLARRFERRGATSFRSFLEHLEARAAETGAAEASPVEDRAGGVRLLTVHKRKGLEFPVVILADPRAPVVHGEPSRHVDHEARAHYATLAGCAPIELLEAREVAETRDREEATRLLYVATTRAADLLVVPIIGADVSDGWLAPLDVAVRPKRGKDAAWRAHPHDPPFGDLPCAADCIFDPKDGRERQGVRPGIARPEQGDHEVLVWDPNLVAEAPPDRPGLRLQALLETDPSGGGANDFSSRFARFSELRAIARSAAKAPSWTTQTVTARAAAGAAPPAVERAKTDAARAGRPSGKRFGTLVHGALELAPWDASDDVIAGLVRFVGRSIGASIEERAAAAIAVRSALDHPILKRAARSPDARREAPIALEEPDGRVEGVIDLVFEEPDVTPRTYLVVDFKTDQNEGDRAESYARQVEVYVRAVALATGCLARGVLLGV